MAGPPTSHSSGHFRRPLGDAVGDTCASPRPRVLSEKTHEGNCPWGWAAAPPREAAVGPPAFSAKCAQACFQVGAAIVPVGKRPRSEGHVRNPGDAEMVCLGNVWRALGGPFQAARALGRSEHYTIHITELFSLPMEASPAPARTSLLAAKLRARPQPVFPPTAVCFSQRCRDKDRHTV